MTAHTGIVQAATWDLNGGADPKSPGLVAGGQRATEDPRSVRLGAGGQSSYWGGPVRPRFSLSVEVTADSKDLLACAFRSDYTTPALQALQLTFGMAGVSWLLEDALINALRLSGRYGEPLVAELDLLGLVETESAALVSPVALSSELLSWGGYGVQVNGISYEVEEFDVDLSNGLEHRWDVDAKAAGSARLPAVLKIGQEEVSLRLRSRSQIPWELVADSPAIDVGAAIAVEDGGNQIGLTFTGLSFNGAPGPPLERGGDIVLWQYELIGKPGSLVLT